MTRFEICLLIYSLGAYKCIVKEETCKRYMSNYLLN